jgi:hypothetical protein
LSNASESETLRAIEAAQQRPWWRLCAYDRGVGLVFLSEGRRRSFWRSDPDHFLVLRSPQYVRWEDDGSRIELTTGARAREVIRDPPPASVLADDSAVVLLHDHGAECCVACDRVSYHTAWRDFWPKARQPSVPLVVHGQHEVGHRLCRPIDQFAHLVEIQGATLQWWRYHVSHTTLVLVATGLPGEPFALQFGITAYVDCPMIMHNVRLRMATAEERAALRPRISSHLAARFDRDRPTVSNVALEPREGLMAIECDEGVFSIWAGVLLLSWSDKTKFAGFV